MGTAVAPSWGRTCCTLRLPTPPHTQTAGPLRQAPRLMAGALLGGDAPPIRTPCDGPPPPHDGAGFPSRVLCGLMPWLHWHAIAALFAALALHGGFSVAGRRMVHLVFAGEAARQHVRGWTAAGDVLRHFCPAFHLQPGGKAGPPGPPPPHHARRPLSMSSPG